MSSYMPKPAEIKRNWRIIDGTDLVLGRLAAKVAMVLQGKDKATYTAHVDTGDFVVIVNAEKVRVTGRKADAIEYDTYSGHPSGRHVYPYRDMLRLHPEKIVELAIRRMLPKSKMGRNLLGKLKIYRGGEHPHSAQQPVALKIA